ncbi:MULTISPECIES: hypothetical protein [unclassified Duganella]|uniref:hypothetical protein n=1 Tax=unclassified Duganella TaxID=2636909 RepID=UPI0011C109A7|nr:MULTISPECIES: hypothetical protein [unclassified Duganella]
MYSFIKPISFLFLFSLCFNSFAQENISKGVATENFSGVWEYRGFFDLGNKKYPVQYTYHLFQTGTRVCGCLFRSGAPNKFLEQYAVQGVVKSASVDLLIDGGSPASSDYSPVFPFEPVGAQRLKKEGKRMLLGDVRAPRDLDKFTFPPEKDVYYLRDMKMAKIGLSADPASCSAEEPDSGLIFIKACLANP